MEKPTGNKVPIDPSFTAIYFFPEQPDQGLTDLSTLGSRAGPPLGGVT